MSIYDLLKKAFTAIDLWHRTGDTHLLTSARDSLAKHLGNLNVSSEDKEVSALAHRFMMDERDIADDIAEGMKHLERIRDCKHRWVEGDNKDRPAYRCTRCGAWRLVA